MNWPSTLQDSGMWQDALRVCKEYLPHKLPQLQDEYDREMTSGKSGKSVFSAFSWIVLLLLLFVLCSWLLGESVHWYLLLDVFFRSVRRLRGMFSRGVCDLISFLPSFM